jgi:mannosyltransferase
VKPAHLSQESSSEQDTSPRDSNFPLRAASVGEWAVLALTTIAAAAFRAHALASKTFWLDEGMSVGIARLDWYNFVRILWRREANMSLYYLLLRFWLHLGNGEAFIRALSVILAVATVPAIYFLGRQVFDSRIGLIAAALLAVNAFHVRWSQEARGYSLMVLLCVLSTLFFVRALGEPSRPNRVAWILFSALAVYAHFFAGLLLCLQWLSLRLLRPTRGNFNRDFGWAALAVSPVVSFIAATGAGPLRWVHRPGLRGLWDFALQFTGSGGALLLIAYLVACVAAVFGADRWKEWRVPFDVWRGRYLLLWLLFPPLFIALLSFARPLFVPRYFIFCLPALFLLAAAGLMRLRSAWLWAAAALLLVALSARGTVMHWNDFDPERDDWRTASHYILANTRPDDALMFHIAAARMPYEFYLSIADQNTHGPVVLYPHHADHITFLDFVVKPDYASLEKSLPQYSRVWLVLSHAGEPGAPDLVSSSLIGILNSKYRDVGTYHFQGIEVRLYSRIAKR